MRALRLLVLAIATASCDEAIAGPSDPDRPTDLTYQLQPSGDPNAPLGVLLQWLPPQSGRAVSFDVYARSSTHDEFGLRATTTSPSFHDAGYPQLQYYVVAIEQGGDELGESGIVTIDERNRLQSPQSLGSTTLNRGVQLAWSSNAYDAAPQNFDFYRVYSTSWASGAGCDATRWALEGTTVSEEFIARNLPNGVTRCFAVSAISRDGHESVWSNIRQDTPRYDAKAILLDAADARRASSGLIISAGGTYATVTSDTAVGVDLVLERRDGVLWFRAARSETRIVQYGASPVSELTAIDRAPTAGYADAARVLAGFGYVARVQYTDGTRYAALRVIHAGADYILFDFAFQPLAGSTELFRAP